MGNDYFLEMVKKNFKEDEPIFIDEILALFSDYTKAYVFRLLKEENEEIRNFSRGVYFLPKKTFFGESNITSNMVANKKYVSNGEDTYGVYAGISLLNAFGITSQVPNVLEIITNKEATRKRTIDIKGKQFILRKSRFSIDNNNLGYYYILQLFLEMPEKCELNDFSREMIIQYIKNKKLNPESLVKYSLYFPGRTLKNVVNSGVFNGIV